MNKEIVTGIKALKPGFYWYESKGKPAVVVEKREKEEFIRFTNGAMQSWVWSTDLITGPMETPQALSNPDAHIEICARLMSSKEHDTDEAVPEVAEDAVAIIRSMHMALVKLERDYEQLQLASQQLKNANSQIAAMSIWGYEKDDGSAYNEVEEPGDGTQDSHAALMGLIENARRLAAMSP